MLRVTCSHAEEVESLLIFAIDQGIPCELPELQLVLEGHGCVRVGRNEEAPSSNASHSI
jgi:hypothetical protein